MSLPRPTQEIARHTFRPWPKFICDEELVICGIDPGSGATAVNRGSPDGWMKAGIRKLMLEAYRPHGSLPPASNTTH